MVKITDISYDKEKGSSRLEFDIEGPEIDYVIMNSIKRTIQSDIPIYAFSEFNFTRNSSVFHNNFLKNQIKNIPVWGINNKLDYYEEIKKNSNLEEDNDELDDNIDLTIEKKVDSTSLEQVTMYVDYENKSNDVEVVTTDHAKFYFAQKNIENPYPIPIQIDKLQSNQKINFSVITTVGTEKESAIYSPVSICVYEEKSEYKYRFIIESRGQISEKRIIEVAILNIIKKLKEILIQIQGNKKSDSENKKEDDLEGEVQINNEDHTIGNLFSHGLRKKTKLVKFAGYFMPHPLEKRVILNYKLHSGKFNEIMKDVIEDYIDFFEKLDKVIDSTINS
jgi:DNA-directed RNA polymerase subunit L